MASLTGGHKALENAQCFQMRQLGWDAPCGRQEKVSKAPTLRVELPCTRERTGQHIAVHMQLRDGAQLAQFGRDGTLVPTTRTRGWKKSDQTNTPSTFAMHLREFPRTGELTARQLEFGEFGEQAKFGRNASCQEHVPQRTRHMFTLDSNARRVQLHGTNP